MNRRQEDDVPTSRSRFPERIAVNFSAGTLARIRAIAEPRGLTVATYIRMAVVGRLRKEREP